MQQMISHQPSQDATVAESSQHPARAIATTRPRRAESFRSMQSQTSDDTASYAGSTPGVGPYGMLRSPFSAHPIPPRASGSRLGFEVATALLDLDLIIIRANRPFEEIMLRGQVARGRHVAEIATPADAEGFQTIRNRLRAEREAREPAYMPPIQQLGQDPVSQIPERDAEQYTEGFSDRTYSWTYASPRVAAETFPVRLRLAKASTYFVMLTLPSFRPLEPAVPTYSGPLMAGPPLHAPERFGPAHSPGSQPAPPTRRHLPQRTPIAAPSMPIPESAHPVHTYPLSRPGIPLTPSYPSYPSGPAAAPRSSAAGLPAAPASFASAAVIHRDPAAFQLPPIVASSMVMAPQGAEPSARAQQASSSEEEEGADGRPRSSKKRRMDIGDVLQRAPQ